MIELLIFGLLVGLDNLQVSASLALLPLQKRRLHLLAAAFCVSEIGGALLGLLLGKALLSLIAPVAEWLAPTVMLGCGIVVLWLALRRDGPNQMDLERTHLEQAHLEQTHLEQTHSEQTGGALFGFANQRALLLGLPLSLSIDNVIAGTGIGIAGYPPVMSALIVGSVSATMACTGLYAGHWFKRFLPQRIEIAVGAYLSVLAIRGFWLER
jgi:manganese efflux pump family protein